VKLSQVKPLLGKLISIPSVTGNEHEIAAYVSDFLSDYGLKIETVEVPGCGPSILASFRGGFREGGLLLYGHLDTVEPTKGWRCSPFKPVVEGSRVYGLGACDMKAGVAAILLAAGRLAEADFKGNLTVALVSDEELYSRGCDTLIRLRKLKGVQAAVSAEPTGLDFMDIARRGRVVYDISIQGSSAHAALLDKRHASNAVREAAKLILALDKLPLDAGGSVSVLSVNGGTDFLTVPDSCKLVLDRHLGVDEKVEEALSQVRTFIENLHLRARFQVKLFKRPTPYMKPYRIGENEPILQAVEQACLRVRGKIPRKRIGLSVGDENYLVGRAGIPTVTLGPRGGNEHGANEYVELPSVVEAANIYLTASTIFLKT
jgi:acetylornithine deacetylase/succinyl-diaminopimelate desuccinylase-like protein